MHDVPSVWTGLFSVAALMSRAGDAFEPDNLLTVVSSPEHSRRAFYPTKLFEDAQERPPAEIFIQITEILVPIVQRVCFLKRGQGSKVLFVKRQLAME